MHYLVVSPAPLFPSTGGSRVLILSMVRMIRAAGHRVSFLYSVQEGASVEADAETAAHVDAYYTCDYNQGLRTEATARAKSRVPPDSIAYNYELDDWYDEAVGKLVAEIYARDPFDAILSNYIWMSKVFEAVPPHVIKIQQTHDAFSDRMIKLSRNGFSPGFFSVSPKDEAKGLGRADINIALQHAEELYFRTLTDKAVFTLQHVPETVPFTTVQIPAGRKLRVGFVGGDNNLNIKALVTLVDGLARASAVADRIELCVVGAICLNFTAGGPSFVTMMGVCKDVRKVYESVDIMVNPMEEGTGLKIKSVEALQYHRPILMTGAGSEGLLSPYHFHRCKSVWEVIGYLKMVADTPALLSPFQAAGEKVLNAYRHRIAKASAVLTKPRDVLDAYHKRMADMQPVAFKGKSYAFCAPVSPVGDGEFDGMARFVPPQATWLDIGSRDGVFALLAAQAFGIRKTILVEGDPDCAERITLNVMRNGLQDSVDMRLLGYAGGAAPGYGKLEAGADRTTPVFSDDADLVPEAVIPFVQLDQFLDEGQRIDVVHIDAPNPFDVLAGLEKTIARCRPVLFIRGAGDERLRLLAQAKSYVLSRQGDLAVLTPVFKDI